MVRPRILLVEDDTALRTSLRKVLEKENYAVSEAATGNEGARLSQKGKFDLIILDYYLGDMTGADFLKSIRGKAESPVMVLSANLHPDMEHEMRGLGATANFGKPITRQDLLEAVKMSIRQGGDDDRA